jgi:tetratricopeptide (TPR) repeat protein
MSPKNHAPLILSLVCVLILSTLAKVYLNSRDEFILAEELVSKNNVAEAVAHYERSLQWHVPGSNLQDRAAEGLWNVAQKFETEKDFENAINAYRLLRGAFFSVRSFYTPGQDWILRCNEKIAVLMAAKPATSESEKSKSYEERLAEYRSLLARQKPPKTSGALVAVFGFLGWIACTVFFIIFAMNKSGEIQSRPALIWGGGFILFYSLWIAGLFYT